MELDVDKRLKIDEPLGTIYSSHKPHPIKVVDTALSETTKADEIASKTAKTSKVTAVVAVRVMLVVPLLNSSICYFSVMLSQTKHK
jgi:hypothetical protein